MRFGIVSCFVFLAVLSGSALAQVNVEGNQRAAGFNSAIYGLGVSAGPASGMGISFRNHLPSRSSYQLIAGIIKLKAKVSASVGAEYQYDLVRGNTTRFFFGPSMSYFYSGEHSNTLAAPFRLGIGVGGEFDVQKALHFSLEGVFTYFSDGSIVPLPQIAAHYYFY
ncbi:MAG: hypothetical protein KGJ59_09080 [Bacteroidota bacterium]|nr:hypothetical protein [Bacteroidota bacterium]